jgi:hypothetical protein
MSGIKWSAAVVLGLMLWAGNGRTEDAAPVTPPKPDANAQNDLEARLKKEADNPTIPEGKGKAKKGGNKAAMEAAGEGSGKYGNTLLATGENFDTNFDGDLNDAEKAKVREAFDKDFAAIKELKDKVMVKYDEDHDDKLTDKEKEAAVMGYVKAAEQRASERHTQFKKLDADNDGKITAEEWAGAAAGKMKKKNKPEAEEGAKGKKREGREEKLFEHALSLCDKDGDHKLDEGEWNKAVGALMDHKIETAGGEKPGKKNKNKA